MLLNQAEREIESLLEVLGSTPGVRSIEPAGSFRRKKETIGDLDLLAETTDPEALMARFVGLGAVDAVIGRGGAQVGGPAAARAAGRPDGRWRRATAGTHLIHFTGSKEHNVRLRARARDRGWTLSEYGFQRIGEDGELLTGPDAELRTFATEAEAYAFLDLPFIEPELREDEGEIEAALAGRLPILITAGRPPRRLPHPQRVERRQPADRGDGRGLPATGLCLRGADRPQPVARDRATADARSGRGGAGDHRRAERPVRGGGGRRHGAARDATEGFRLLHGCELEVRADATLDYDDELLASLRRRRRLGPRRRAASRGRS